MNPAWSVIFFTTLAGAAQGMVVTLALSKLAGVLAERWFFFAQARHPQNLYYQVVS